LFSFCLGIGRHLGLDPGHELLSDGPKQHQTENSPAKQPWHGQQNTFSHLDILTNNSALWAIAGETWVYLIWACKSFN
jgi:hypothetical protein